MIQLILGLLAGLVPSLVLFFWLRGLQKDPAYKGVCNKFFVAGLVATFPIILLSGALYLLLRLSGLNESNPLIYSALYKFVVLAFSEELIKYLAFKRTLEKTEYACSWLDLTVFMTVVGVAFGVLESLVYLIGSNPIVMLIRGITVPHGGLGAIVGYFYGRSLKTGRRSDRVLGFVISWFLHGLYDFSLSAELISLNENLMLIAIALAVLNLVLIIALIIFVLKARRKAKYTAPLIGKAGNVGN